MKVHNLVVTGSLTSGGENISTISSSVATTVTELSSSLTSSIGSLSSSMVTMVTNMSSSITASIGSMSSSMSNRFDTLQSTTSSLNSFTSSASGRLNSVEGKTGSYATTGSNTFVGLQTIQGSIVPASHATYDLGSAGYNFRHLYLSSASLYIDGTKVLGSTSQELQITTDAGQSFKILEAGSDTITLQSNDGNITLATSGGGDVILDPTTGIIALKGTTTIYAGNKVLSSDGNAIQFGNSVTMTGSLIVTGYIETQELKTTYISSSILYRSGSTKFGDELTDTHAFSGSVLISGSLSVPGSGLISGSSQILNGSGVWSGSVQLPSGVVSGSVQVDVMSTTNIARLATTGSNTFSGGITATGNATTTPSFVANNAIGSSGTAQHYLDFTAGATTIGRILRGNGASGLIANGINIDSYGGFQVRLNQLGGSGDVFNISGGNTIVTGSLTTTGNIKTDGVVNWNGTVGALSYGGGTVTMETNTAVPILIKTNGTTAITVSTGQTVTFASDISLGGNILTGVDKAIRFDSSGASGHPEIGVDSSANLNFKNTAGTTNLTLSNGGNLTVGGSITTSAGLNSTKNVVAGEATPLHLNYSTSDGTGPAVRFGGGGGQGFWDIQPSNNNQRISFEWSDSVNTLSLMSDGRVGINDTNPSRKLTVNFGTSINDGLIVYGSQRLNTVFQSTGEHCFIYMDSHHANTFLPKLHFQRSSTTYGTIGLERASNSDSIGSYTESEVIVGSTTTVPVSIQTNNVRRIKIESAGNVNVYNALSVTGNLGARNFVKYVKSWSTNGSYTWHTELATIASAFDSACWYKGFIRESNGAHYNGYQFDIHVGQIGYGGTANQFVVRNMTFAGGPWTGGCGSSSFAAIDNSGFTKQNSGCFDTLEMFITRIG